MARAGTKGRSTGMRAPAAVSQREMASATKFRETYRAVARNLRCTRERRELTIEQLSQRSNVPGDRIRALEAGREMDDVGLAELDRLSGALNLPLRLLVDTDADGGKGALESRSASAESPRGVSRGSRRE